MIIKKLVKTFVRGVSLWANTCKKSTPENVDGHHDFRLRGLAALVNLTLI